MLFPTMSLYNIGYTPVLRVDFLSQICLLSYILIFKQIQANVSNVLSFFALIIFYPLLNVFNVFVFENFDLFEYSEMFIQILIMMSLFYLIISTPVNFSIEKLLNYIIVFGVIVSIYAFYQIVSLNYVELPFSSLIFSSPRFAGTSVVSEFSSFNRPTSIFYEPSHLGFFLQLVMIIYFFKFKNTSIDFRTVFVFLIVFFAFLSTISIFNYLSFSITSFIFSKRARIIVIFGLIPFLIWLYFSEIQTPLDRIFSIFDSIVIHQDILSSTDGSLIRRIGKLLAGLSAFKDNLIIGTGLNNLILGTRFFSPGDWNIYYGEVNFVNLYFLQILAETGIIGFSAFSIFLYFIWKSLKLHNIQDPNIRSIAGMAKAIFIAMILSQDLPFASPYRVIYLVIIALVIRNLTDYKRLRLSEQLNKKPI